MKTEENIEKPQSEDANWKRVYMVVLFFLLLFVTAMYLFSLWTQ